MQLLRRPELLRQLAYSQGQWLQANTKEILEVHNPATGAYVGSVPKFGADETAQAIQAAHQAGTQWRLQSAKARAQILRRWYELVMEHQEDLARIMTIEQGKPLAEAKAEIAYGAAYIEWYSEEARRVNGEVIPSFSSDSRIVVTKEPVGVCAAITPWNFPSSMITRKAGAALAAGCTMVVKPASQTPFSALALAFLAEEAGIPAGVFSVITGSASAIGTEMTSNPLVRKLSFTGSTAVGRTLMAQSAPQLKKLSMELGGNAPFIVFEDADIDQAVAGAVASKYRNAGQTCVCTNRFYVHEAVHDEFVHKLVSAVETLKVGNGLTGGVQVGPLIDEAAMEKVCGLVADATEKGASVVTGGEALTQLGPLFYQPTVLTNSTSTMLLAKEEIFGPVAPVFRFRDEAEVIRLANDTEYGLAAYFYSRDVGRVWRVAEALEYGMVGINAGIISNEAAPFGGVKQSGFGREGSHYGIEEYLVLKYMLIGGV